MDDWQVFAEKLTLLMLIAVTRISYRIAEWFGSLGIKCEVKYHQLIAT